MTMNVRKKALVVDAPTNVGDIFCIVRPYYDLRKRGIPLKQDSSNVQDAEAPAIAQNLSSLTTFYIEYNGSKKQNLRQIPSKLMASLDAVNAFNRDTVCVFQCQWCQFYIVAPNGTRRIFTPSLRSDDFVHCVEIAQPLIIKMHHRFVF